MLKSFNIMQKQMSLSEQQKRESAPDPVTKWLFILILIGALALIIKGLVCS